MESPIRAGHPQSAMDGATPLYLEGQPSLSESVWKVGDDGG